MKTEFSLRLEERRERCERILMELLPKEEGLEREVTEAMNYSLLSGGKRLRPILMLEGYELFSPNEERDRLLRPLLYAFMAGMEMIHSFSLCHDDLPCMDGDRYRRGRKSTWYRYGEAMGTLAGDGLSLYAFQLVSKTAAEGFLKPSFSRYASCVNEAVLLLSSSAGIHGMLGGQAADVRKTGQEMGEEELLLIYERKTAALISGALSIGAILAGASAESIALLREISKALGLAFQIRDDILDESGAEAELGKPIHSDRGNHKTTYVSLRGLPEAEREVSRLSERAEQRLLSLSGERISEEHRDFLRELFQALVSRRS